MCRGYCHELASQVLGAGRQGGKQLDDSDPTRGVIIALHRPQGPGPRIHTWSGRLSWCYGHSIEMLIKSNIRPARSLCCVATRQRLPICYSWDLIGPCAGPGSSLPTNVAPNPGGPLTSLCSPPTMTLRDP
ncbi:hypothetical protein V2G26_000813 [Clonostachys chloroleuca]